MFCADLRFENNQPDFSDVPSPLVHLSPFPFFSSPRRGHAAHLAEVCRGEGQGGPAREPVRTADRSHRQHGRHGAVRLRRLHLHRPDEQHDAGHRQPGHCCVSRDGVRRLGFMVLLQEREWLVSLTGGDGRRGVYGAFVCEK